MNTRAYYPAITIFLLSLLFLFAPKFMASLVALGLATVAFVYAYFVYKFNRAVRFKDVRDMSEFDQKVYESGGPSFRNVTVTVLKSSPLS